jgi:hypothetical protein
MRPVLPKPSDRLPMGGSGLAVSPFCLGLTATPETVIAAYESGINFFFITGDLHWPLYDGLRQGLARLLKDNPSRRQELVVGVVSYLDNPLFGALQFHEVIGEIPGLQYVDLLIAGGVPSETSFYSRLDSLAAAKRRSHNGARAIGATFHQRTLALLADYYDLLDISFIRYNAAHPGARRDLFPFLRQGRKCPVFNFKSVMAQVPRDTFDSLGLPSGYWCPDACDYYRFVLSRPEIDGVLCAPQSPEELRGLVRSMDRGPVSREEEEYMTWLSGLTQAPVLT